MSRHASPAAQLLRNSRLFSLPQSLPKPSLEQALPSMDLAYRDSSSASTPYPLRQSIITPSSSAHRGDWGLKRPLPARGARRSSNPTHSVIANDTYEGVTEYASASGYVRTLERFQELNVGMSRQDRKQGIRASGISAMEPSLDFTDGMTGGSRRWKYGGASVRTMTPGDFEKFLEKTVKGRKEEFIALLRCRCYISTLEAERNAGKRAMEEDSEESNSSSLAQHTLKSAYTDWLIHMRDNRPELISSYFTRGTKNEQLSYITALKHALRERWWTEELEAEMSAAALQLKELLSTTAAPKPSLITPSRPAVGKADAAQWLKYLHSAELLEQDFVSSYSSNPAALDRQLADFVQQLRSDKTLQAPLLKVVRQFLDMPAPNGKNFELARELPEILKDAQPEFSLSTHPTAGLSYLRSRQVLHNHPILGPQEKSPPVKARVLGKTFDGKTNHGVAGFVAKSEQGQVPARDDPHFIIPGGQKVERTIQNAYVDGFGRVQIVLEQSNNVAKGVRDGLLEPDLAHSGQRTEQARKQAGAGLLGSLRDASQRREPKKVEPYDDSAVKKLLALSESLKTGEI